MTARGKANATSSDPQHHQRKLNKWLPAAQHDLSTQSSPVCLPLCGAPLGDTPADMPAGEPSGEEQAGPSDLLGGSPVWHMVLGATKRHQMEEACLHRLAHGLYIYTVLLKHVEKEYPGNVICSVVKCYSGLLINLIKHKMRNPEQVTALSSNQEAQLLGGLNHLDAFQRKMTAHSILRQLHHFLVDSKRAITKKENGKNVRQAFGTYQLL
ncbi:Interleukin-6 [Liparis tanakae]|uniref:Interleukin-6 n=1 Tax=Liparis tanakae TaxID=230148 RepID=A0A4Z2EJG4_9TELE|nr:Interleukin-6 [Liparis tanakae]